MAGRSKARTDSRTEKKKPSKGLQRRNSDAGSMVDLDRHPLAALRLDTFTEVGTKFYEDWFRGNGEQQVVVPSKKRAREEQDSESPVLRKRAPKERGA